MTPLFLILNGFVIRKTSGGKVIKIPDMLYLNQTGDKRLFELGGGYVTDNMYVQLYILISIFIKPESDHW